MSRAKNLKSAPSRAILRVPVVRVKVEVCKNEIHIILELSCLSLMIIIPCDGIKCLLYVLIFVATVSDDEG